MEMTFESSQFDADLFALATNTEFKSEVVDIWGHASATADDDDQAPHHVRGRMHGVADHRAGTPRHAGDEFERRQQQIDDDAHGRHPRGDRFKRCFPHSKPISLGR